jgi:transposase
VPNPAGRDALQEAARLAGKYILATSMMDEEACSMNEIMHLYKNRDLVETRMRNLKHDIKVRPVFLQNDDRIRAPLS